MPFSEPETQNIRALHSERQITNLITNHTYSNLVLRPPGVADTGFPLEEPLLRDLGAAMTSHNNYANDPSFELYDTTGGTEDWTFWTAGGLGYTFEIGPDEFHPPYQTGVVAEYLGSGTRGRRRPGRQPRGLLRDARGHGQLPLPLAGHGPRAGGSESEDQEELHDRHLPGVERRLRQRHRQPDAVPGFAGELLPLRGRPLPVAYEPVDAAGRGRALRTGCHRPAAGSDHPAQPGRTARGERSTTPRSPTMPFRSRFRVRPPWTTAG